MRKKVLLSLLAATPAAFNAYADAVASGLINDPTKWDAGDNNLVFTRTKSDVNGLTGVYTYGPNGSYVSTEVTLLKGKYEISYKTLSNAYFTVEVDGTEVIKNGKQQGAELDSENNPVKYTFEVKKDAGSTVKIYIRNATEGNTGSMYFSDGELSIDYDFVAKIARLKALIPSDGNDGADAFKISDLKDLTDGGTSYTADSKETILANRPSYQKYADDIKAVTDTLANIKKYIEELTTNSTETGVSITTDGSTITAASVPYALYAKYKLYNDGVDKDNKPVDADDISKGVAQLKKDIEASNKAVDGYTTGTGANATKVLGANEKYVFWKANKTAYDKDKATLDEALSADKGYDSFIQAADEETSTAAGDFYSSSAYVQKYTKSAALDAFEATKTTIYNKLQKYMSGSDFIDTAAGRYGAAANDKTNTPEDVAATDATTLTTEFAKVRAAFDEYSAIQKYFDDYATERTAFNTYYTNTETDVIKTFGADIYQDIQKEVRDFMEETLKAANTKALIADIVSDLTNVATDIEKIENKDNKAIRLHILGKKEVTSTTTPATTSLEDDSENPTPNLNEIYNKTTDGFATSAQALINAKVTEKKAIKEACDGYAVDTAEGKLYYAYAQAKADFDATKKAFEGYTEENGNKVASTFTGDDDQAAYFTDEIAKVGADLDAWKAALDQAYASHEYDGTNKTYTYAKEEAVKTSVDNLKANYKKANNTSNQDTAISESNATIIKGLQEEVTKARVALNEQLGTAFGYNDGIKDGGTEADATETKVAFDKYANDPEYKPAEETATPSQARRKQNDVVSTEVKEEEPVDGYTAKDPYEIGKRFSGNIDGIKASIVALNAKYAKVVDGYYQTISETEQEALKAQLASVITDDASLSNNMIKAYGDANKDIQTLQTSIDNFSKAVNGVAADGDTPAVEPTVVYAPAVVLENSTKDIAITPAEGETAASFSVVDGVKAGTIVAGYDSWKAADLTKAGDDNATVAKTDGNSKATDFKDGYKKSDAQATIKALQDIVDGYTQYLINNAKEESNDKAYTNALAEAKTINDFVKSGDKTYTVNNNNPVEQAQKVFEDQVKVNNQAIYEEALLSYLPYLNKLINATQSSGTTVGTGIKDFAGAVALRDGGDQVPEAFEVTYAQAKTDAANAAKIGDMAKNIKALYGYLTLIISNEVNKDELDSAISNADNEGSLASKLAAAKVLVNGDANANPAVEALADEKTQEAWNAKLHDIADRYYGTGTTGSGNCSTHSVNSISSDVATDYAAIKLSDAVKTTYSTELTALIAGTDIAEAIRVNNTTYATIFASAQSEYDNIGKLITRLESYTYTADSIKTNAVAAAKAEQAKVTAVQSKVLADYLAANIAAGDQDAYAKTISDAVAAANKIESDHLATWAQDIKDYNNNVFDGLYVKKDADGKEVKDEQGNVVYLTFAEKVAELTALYKEGVNTLSSILNIHNAGYKAYVGSILGDTDAFYAYYNDINALNSKKDNALALSVGSYDAKNAYTLNADGTGTLYTSSSDNVKAVTDEVARIEDALNNAIDDATGKIDERAKAYYTALTTGDNGAKAAIKVATDALSAAGITVVTTKPTKADTWYNADAFELINGEGGSQTAYNAATARYTNETKAVASKGLGYTAHESLDGVHDSNNNGVANLLDAVIATNYTEGLANAATTQWKHDYNNDGAYRTETTDSKTNKKTVTYSGIYGDLAKIEDQIAENCTEDTLKVQAVDAEGKLATDKDGKPVYTTKLVIDEAYSTAKTALERLNDLFLGNAQFIEGEKVNDKAAYKEGVESTLTGTRIGDLVDYETAAKAAISTLQSAYNLSADRSGKVTALADAQKAANETLQSLIDGKNDKGEVASLISTDALQAYVTGIAANDGGAVANALAEIEKAQKAVDEATEASAVNANKANIEKIINDAYTAAYNAEITYLRGRVDVVKAQFTRYTAAEGSTTEAADAFNTRIKTAEDAIAATQTNTGVTVAKAKAAVKKTAISDTSIKDDFLAQEKALDQLYVDIVKATDSTADPVGDATTAAKADAEAAATAVSTAKSTLTGDVLTAISTYGEKFGEGVSTAADLEAAAKALDDAVAAVNAKIDAEAANDSHIISAQVEIGEDIAAVNKAADEYKAAVAAAKAEADALATKKDANDAAYTTLSGKLNELTEAWAAVKALAAETGDTRFDAANSDDLSGETGKLAKAAEDLTKANEAWTLTADSKLTDQASIESTISTTELSIYEVYLRAQVGTTGAAGNIADLRAAANEKLESKDKIANRTALKAQLAEIAAVLDDVKAADGTVTTKGLISTVQGVLPTQTYTVRARKAEAEAAATLVWEKATAVDLYGQVKDVLAKFGSLDEAIENNTLLEGDAKLDGKVAVSDYQQIVDWILSDEIVVADIDKVDDTDAAELGKLAADFNNDGEINVGDLTNVLNIIIGNKQTAAKQRLRARVEGTLIDNGTNLISAEVVEGEGSDSRIAVYLANANAFVAGQFDIKLPAGMSLQSSELTNRADGLEVQTSDLANGYTRVLIAATELHTIASGDGVLVYLDVTGNGSNIVIDNAVFADQAAKTYAVQSANTSGIGAIIVDSVKNGAQRIYDVSGRVLNRVQRGINIIRNADGTTTKQINKK
jgi:hypothetical protein